MSLAASERETTVTSTDDNGTVRIWTNQKRHLGKLRRHPSFTETKSGHHGTTEWAEFTIPADQWNPASGAKRKARPMTEDERTEAAARLARYRSVTLAERVVDSNGSPDPYPTPTPEASA